MIAAVSMSSHLSLAIILLISHTLALPPRAHHEQHRPPSDGDAGVQEIDNGWKITDLSKFLSEQELNTLRINYHLNHLAEKLRTVSKPAAFGADMSTLPDPVRREILAAQGDDTMGNRGTQAGDFLSVHDVMMGDAPMAADNEEEEQEEEKEKITKVTLEGQYIVSKPGRHYFPS